MTQANNVAIESSQINSSGVLLTTGGGTGLSTVGTNGQVLTSNGTTLSWVTPTTTSPGGSTTQVQYNLSGAFAGNSGFTFDGQYLSLGTLRIGPDVGYNWIYQGGSGTVLGLTANGGAITFGQTSSEQMRLESGGNLLVGGTSNSLTARIIAIGTDNNNLIASYNTSTGNAGIRIQANQAGLYIQGSGTVDPIFITNTSATGYIAFRPSSNTEKMRLNANGQLFIGTATLGVTDCALAVSNAGANGMEFSTTAVSTENRLLSYNRSGATYAAMNYAASQHKFLIGGTQQAAIDSSGVFSFNSGYGSAATAYGCRAWANYNASGGSIRASGGISSITKNSNGFYTINFSITFPDTNYSTTVNAGSPNSSSYETSGVYTPSNTSYGNKTTTAVQINCYTPAVANYDPYEVNIIVMR